MRLKILLLGILFFCINLFGQIKKGLNINGEALNDFSGYSISMSDENTVAIGAPNNSGFLQNSGHVRVFKWDGSNWQQKGKDIDGKQESEKLGVSVCMVNANTLAIGAIGVSSGSLYQGLVRIYEWRSSSWVQKGPDIVGEKIGDYLGKSISMPDTNTIAIGAYGKDGNAADVGSVRVFEWNGTNWVQKGNTILGKQTYEKIGYSVSMSDKNTLVTGGTWQISSDLYSGVVRVYKWTGSSWVQKGKDMNGKDAGELFGHSISMPDSNLVAIGAPLSDLSGGRAGSVYVFNWDKNTDWIAKGSIITGEPGYELGYSLSMPNKESICIGARYASQVGDSRGQMLHYFWVLNDWKKVGNEVWGKFQSDLFGTSVSMPSPRIAAVGAIGNDDNGFESGHVQVYKLCPPSIKEINVSACGFYKSPSGKKSWKKTGKYIDTIKNVFGCDSIIFINLKMDSLNLKIIQNFGRLKSEQLNAKYQWLDCNLGFKSLKNDTQQIFTPISNGLFACKINYSNCIDTSECKSVKEAQIYNWNEEVDIQVYPNPFNNNIYIKNNLLNFEITRVQICDIVGRILIDKKTSNLKLLQVKTSSIKNGQYLIKINSNSGNYIIKKSIKS